MVTERDPLLPMRRERFPRHHLRIPMPTTPHLVFQHAEPSRLECDTISINPMQLSCLNTTRDAIINFEFVGGRPFTGQGIGDRFDIAKSNEIVEGARVDAGATWSTCWTVTNDDGRPVIAI